MIQRIGGVMVSVLGSSAVDHGFGPRLGKTKDDNIGICYLIKLKIFSIKLAAMI
jgi:hypothetical protein